MKKNKHILLITQYFYPEQFRINDICSEWIDKGYEVTVVTSIPNYPKGSFFDGYGLFKKRKDNYNGINIIRIPVIPRGNDNLIKMSLNYISFVVSGFFWKIFNKVDADLVFNYTTSPIFQALPAVWYAKKKKLPCYIYILDMWPQSLEAVVGVKSKIIIKSVQKICDYIYKNSTKIFVSSEGFIEPIVLRNVPLDKVIFWPQYAEDFYIPIDKNCVKITEIPDDNKFNIIFAGNIGYAQGLEILPKVAELIKLNDKKIRICMVGNGRYKETLIKAIKEKSVEDVFCFIDSQPPDRIPDFMAFCDASLVILQKNELFAMTVPAKIQSCMACGIPIILSADGETQKIIKESECGLFSEASNATELFNNMVEMSQKNKDELLKMRSNGRKYFEQHYKKDILLSEMDNYINNI